MSPDTPATTTGPHFDLSEHSHRRRSPLTGQWVLVSPQRGRRPWQGRRETGAEDSGTRYDADCFLCPGNRRTSGRTNPAYEGTFVFENDHPALMAATPQAGTGHPLFQVQAARGTSRVLCYSPDHSRTLPELEVPQITEVVQAWCEQTADLGRRHAWVQVFENKGEAMGCSQPHPHGQVWATDYLPSEPATEEFRLKLRFEGAPGRAEVEKLIASGVRERQVQGAYRIDQREGGEYVVTFGEKPTVDAVSGLIAEWRNAPNVAEVSIDGGAAP